MERRIGKIEKDVTILKRRGRATVIREILFSMPPGNWEGEKVFMICKPGDLPVMAVIYLRVRGNARRMGFLK